MLCMFRPSLVRPSSDTTLQKRSEQVRAFLQQKPLRFCTLAVAQLAAPIQTQLQRFDNADQLALGTPYLRSVVNLPIGYRHCELFAVHNSTHSCHCYSPSFGHTNAVT